MPFIQFIHSFTTEAALRVVWQTLAPVYKRYDLDLAKRSLDLSQSFAKYAKVCILACCA